ncbi:HlyD family efflux transporter periplasmic adaptor subunit [Alteromonadaceae bacterium M269]|nr:HlyD family efflux transporter periplasmic adaptor subunit [Alteromonadaceae bacterium M269]
MSLFRKEVFSAKKRSMYGGVFLVTPLSYKIITSILAALLLLSVVILITGVYTRTEKVTGYLVPSKGGVVKIQTGRAGTLKTLHFNEGDVVNAGDVLLEIQVEQTSTIGNSTEDRTLEKLNEQKLNLLNQISLAEQQQQFEQTRIQSEIEATSREITLIKAQIEIQQDMSKSAKSAYDNIQNLLSKGLISQAESERERQSWLSQQSQEKVRLQELDLAVERLNLLKLELSSSPNRLASQITQLKGQVLEGDIRTTELIGRKGYVIKAPVNGRIASIASKAIGQSVRSQQQILTILPTDNKLQAELFVPSKAIGFVREGQEVRLLYSAFPYQRFGSYKGKISNVTHSILSPSEAGTPFQVGGPAYRVTAEIEKQAVTVDGEDISLQSGMQLSANIVLEQYTFWNWLLEPLQALGQKL